MPKQLKVTLKKSKIGCRENQKRTVESLNLNKIHKTIIVKETPAIRGMIRKISHLVDVEELE